MYVYMNMNIYIYIYISPSVGEDLFRVAARTHPDERRGRCGRRGLPPLLSSLFLSLSLSLFLSLSLSLYIYLSIYLYIYIYIYTHIYIQRESERASERERDLPEATEDRATDQLHFGEAIHLHMSPRMVQGAGSGYWFRRLVQENG